MADGNHTGGTRWIVFSVLAGLIIFQQIPQDRRTQWGHFGWSSQISSQSPLNSWGWEGSQGRHNLRFAKSHFMDSHVAVEVSLEGQACLCVCVFSCLCLLHTRSWEGGNIWCLTYSWRRQDGCEQSWEHGLHQRLPVSSCAPLAVSSCRPLHFLCPLSSAHIPVVRGVVIFCNSQWRICCILLMKILFFFSQKANFH